MTQNTAQFRRQQDPGARIPMTGPIWIQDPSTHRECSGILQWKALETCSVNQTSPLLPVACLYKLWRSTLVPHHSSPHLHHLFNTLHTHPIRVFSSSIYSTMSFQSQHSEKYGKGKGHVSQPTESRVTSDLPADPDAILYDNVK